MPVEVDLLYYIQLLYTVKYDQVVVSHFRFRRA